MKLNRLLSIVLLIEAKEHVTAKELSTLFEVSVRTIYRDIDLLCEAGVPIYATSGPKGGFTFIEGYRLDSKTLDKHDMEKLLLSVYGQMIKDNSMDSSRMMDSSFLLKLRKILPKNEQENFERLIHTTKLDSMSWWGKEKDIQTMESMESNIDIIQKSIYQLKQVSFDYESYREITYGRILSPYGIVHKGDAWYVVGFSQERNEVRTFHTERMKQVRITEVTYEMPKDFELETYWERSTREFVRKSLILDANSKQYKHSVDQPVAEIPVWKYKVHLVGNEATARLLTGFNIINQFKDERGIHFEVDLISEKTALSILLLHLDRIQILEPASLRERVLELAKNILVAQK